MSAKEFGDVMAGFVIGVMILVVIFALSQELHEVDLTIQKRAVLPDTCRIGEQVLMTTAATAEYYRCEGHWVRK